MDSELILKSISRHITLNGQEEKRFLALLQPRSIRRKQFFLHRGEVCRHSAFVLSGCLRSYTIDDNGFEHILNFSPSGWWSADLYSLISQQPAYLHIDALEECQLLQLSKTDQEKLYAEIPQFERYFRILVENSLVAHQQRILHNMSLTAEERYQNFCRLYPSLVDRLPQKYIASYIGVTPEFFSRMRSKLLRNK